MKIQYLGTAASEGWPALFCSCPACEKARSLGGKNIRTRAQAVVDDKLLLDFGPDTYLHVLRDGLKLHEIRHCLITHGHADHFYPSDLVMKGAPYALDGEKQPFYLYGSGDVGRIYERMRKLDDDSPNLDECMKFCKIRTFESFQAGDYKVTPLRAVHNLKEECFIFLIEDKQGKNMLYGHDTAYFPEETWEALKDRKLDLVSLDCTMGILGDGTTHMGYKGNIRTKERMIQAGIASENTTFILNHFSHNCGHGLPHEEMEELAKKDGFLVAYDGFTAEF